jgi:hypothetical protein
VPFQMKSVWPEMPFMRGPEGAERLRWWMQEQRSIRTAVENRRARVLAYEWAATRLRHILQIADARHWNGFVPPLLDHEGDPNSSSIRRALIELLRDVAETDQKGSVDGAE